MNDTPQEEMLFFNGINGDKTGDSNPDFDAPDMIALELYLMSRAHGMPMEAPAVRP